MSLTVYKSSAGSGKTTTLVNEYLKIALDKPNHFRHILAITFTNKAANEMKERVISTLQSFIDESKEIDKKHQVLLISLNNDILKLRERSSILLNLILHNYDEFAVSTIDSFIHRIIRTFATDVRLPQNFEVVIDENDIIPDIIHCLYEKVGYDEELTKLLTDFVLSQADEENKYDPTSKLVEFVKHHMREDGFMHIKKLDSLNLTQLADVISRLRNKIASEKKIITETATLAIDLCSKNNLEKGDFFSGKNGILGFFEKVKETNTPDDKLITAKTPLKTVNEDKWFSSNATESVKSSIISISKELAEFYLSIIEHLRNHLYYNLIYSKIYSLALIHEIRKTFEEQTDISGKVHISEFNKKISDEIAGQPVPYIYERLGRKYRYFLIDEFQDTSVLQWQNLLPLIDESLSYQQFNMLVGDAKQAIYRFRSGEVELFTSLPELYGNDGSVSTIERQNTIKREYKEENLSTNWRSYPEIIKFNNDFFSTISGTLSHRTMSIYKDLIQTIPKNKSGGFVSLNFFEAENTEGYLDKKHFKIVEIIKNALAGEYDKKDICILCRTKKRATGIAEYLLENGIDVISSESLLITNSPKVRLIISFLKLYNDPDNELALAEFIENYKNSVNQEYDFHKAITLVRNSRKQGVNKVFELLKLQETNNGLAALSTYEIAEFVLRNIICDDKPDVFVQYLLDFVFEYNLSLDDFILKWNEKSEKLYITMPEDLDAIRIMTIHKAKGLDFPVVIVDAENIRNSNTRDEYWEDLNLAEFKELKTALLPLTQKIELIDRADIYQEEKNKTELDFLNLIYVATTRPVKALYTVARLGTKDKFSEYLVTYLNLKGLWEEKKMVYEFGKLPYGKDESDKKTEKPEKLNTFVSTNWTKLITVAASENLIHDITTGKSSRTYGKLIHNILANIQYKSDFKGVIDHISDSGILSETEVEIITSIIEDVINDSKLSTYFSDNLIVKNETEIILENGDLVRPDRVVIGGDQITIIDYKTGEEKEKDHQQVRDYKSSFLALGYQNISCKLVYLKDTIRIVDVV